MPSSNGPGTEFPVALYSAKFHFLKCENCLNLFPQKRSHFPLKWRRLLSDAADRTGVQRRGRMASDSGAGPEGSEKTRPGDRGRAQLREVEPRSATWWGDVGTWGADIGTPPGSPRRVFGGFQPGATTRRGHEDTRSAATAVPFRGVPRYPASASPLDLLNFWGAALAGLPFTPETWRAISSSARSQGQPCRRPQLAGRFAFKSLVSPSTG